MVTSENLDRTRSHSALGLRRAGFRQDRLPCSRSPNSAIGWRRAFVRVKSVLGRSCITSIPSRSCNSSPGTNEICTGGLLRRTELQQQLVGTPLLAPQRVLSGHAPDQLAQYPADRRASRSLSAAPEQAPAGSGASGSTSRAEPRPGRRATQKAGKVKQRHSRCGVDALASRRAPGTAQVRDGEIGSPLRRIVAVLRTAQSGRRNRPAIEG